MSLPPGFLDELRARLSMTQVAGRKVMWDQRKSNQAKGDMWAPCPFHHEKTASFHVDDRKGYYYCFGCHAKGDAISFVRETENVSFIEAVEILAGEAGMQMPARDPQAQQKADRRSQLIEVMEMAVKFFRLQLSSGAGGAARDYLDRRGLSPEAQARWEIGFAPDAWQGLWDHLAGKGVAEKLILDAGLARESRKGGKPYDVFRNRIMFPIRDARGRAIAFGGRAMDPNDQAKYLNSPETELFDKGRTLFNHARAREAAGKGAPLIVAEGYMDVIALSEAGFGAAVAPLGTAVTEHQLDLLWRIAPEPLIALDGDTAGMRAAEKVVDLALPRLEAGRSLRFALMPEGKDPDDLIRAKGAGAVQKVLDEAIPMVRLLWQRETEGRVFDSPERKAALDKSLRDRLKTIADPSIRSHYGAEIKDLRWQLFRPQRAPGGGKRKAGAPPVMATSKASLLAASPEAAELHLREAVILATILATPDVLAEVEGRVADMPCADSGHRSLRDAILAHAGPGAGLRDHVAARIGQGALDALASAAHVRIAPAPRKPGDLELARLTVTEELSKIDALCGRDSEFSEVTEDLSDGLDERATWRLSEVARGLNQAWRADETDNTEYEIGANGAQVSKDERNAFGALLNRIDFSKRREKP